MYEWLSTKIIPQVFRNFYLVEKVYLSYRTKTSLFGITFKKPNTSKKKTLLIHLLFSFFYNLCQQNRALEFHSNSGFPLSSVRNMTDFNYISAYENVTFVRKFWVKCLLWKMLFKKNYKNKKHKTIKDKKTQYH